MFKHPHMIFRTNRQGQVFSVRASSWQIHNKHSTRQESMCGMWPCKTLGVIIPGSYRWVSPGTFKIEVVFFKATGLGYLPSLITQNAKNGSLAVANEFQGKWVHRSVQPAPRSALLVVSRWNSTLVAATLKNSPVSNRFPLQASPQFVRFTVSNSFNPH